MKNKLLLNLITKAIIPLLLLSFWIISSIFLNENAGFTILNYEYSKKNFTNYTTNELHAGKKVLAEFTAKDNHLGNVSVRFYNFSRISGDKVIFRIKEKSSEKWIYENEYKVDQFQPDKYFPFGFNPIPDSKNKQYLFEIQSLKGKKGNAIGLSSVEPAFSTQHQYNKSQLLSNKMELAGYLLKKIVNSYSSITFTIASFIYLLPFIFYLLWQIYLKDNMRSYLNKSKKFPPYSLLIIYFITALASVVFSLQTNGYINIVFFALWMIIAITHKLESNVTFLVSLIFLSLCPLLLIFKLEKIAESAAIFCYLMLANGTIQSVFELKKSNIEQVDYKEFIKYFKQNIKVVIRLAKNK